jgi:hypothetical protein
MGNAFAKAKTGCQVDNRGTGVSTDVFCKIVYIIDLLSMPFSAFIEPLSCQLINTITHKPDITLFIYSVLYLCVIAMIGIFVYWDTIYKTAKKLSKCNNISKIIDESVYTETPYVYTIIIINTKRIKKLSEYIIKITYDFNKMETRIEYGNTEGEDAIFQYRINDYKSVLEDIKALETQKTNLDTSVTKDATYRAEMSRITLQLMELKNSDEGKKALQLRELQSSEKKKFYDSFDYKYFNLNTMKPDVIEDLSLRINSNTYKYYAVDKDFNMIQSYTTSELIKFTKGYSDNENYPMSIIDYIIFSKIQRDKNINI